MADKLHISRQQYCNIENGKAEAITPGHIKVISELLGLPEDQVDIRGNIALFPAGPEQRFSNTGKGMLSEELFATLIEQNKRLMQLLEQLSDKLKPAGT